MAHQEDKKNIAIFAHYDKHQIVDDYVLIYLRNLKKFCDKIIFVSDGDLSAKERQKIFPFVSEIIAQRHQEYDFGSWKLGFHLLKEKYPQDFSSADKLIFANDSCYCLGEFDDVFAQIESMPNVDCFGITDSAEYSYHLQSYFLVFNKTVFLTDFFDNFIQKISQQSFKIDIIKDYEIGLSELLVQNHKKLYAIFGRDVLQNYSNQNRPLIIKKILKIIGLYQMVFGIKRIFSTLFEISDCCYCYHNTFYLLILNGSPLLKRSIILKDFAPKKSLNSSSLCYFWKKIVNAETVFDDQVITKHATRISQAK
ncbi:MAG: rhamnan synthesis F family protein [Pseudomonadota bacterium]